MNTVPKPIFHLNYGTGDVSAALEPFLVRLAWTDILNGHSGRLDITLENREGLFASTYMPQRGDDLTFDIGWDGGDLQGVWRAGRFITDEFELTGPPDTTIIRAITTDSRKPLREKHSRAYENVTLEQVAQKIAAAGGIVVQGEFPKITFDRLTQHAETDLQFLQRLADTWGGILRIDNDIVTFYLLQKVLDQDSELVISRSDVVRYAMRSKTADQPRASVSRHWDPVKKGQYKPLASPAQVPMGVVKMAPEAPAGAFPTLGAWGARIDVERVGHRAESTAQAEALMAAAMARAQLGKFQGTLSLPGDPRLRAGVPVALDGTWLGMAGIYVVTQAVHDLTKAGYQTHIDLAKGTSNAVKHRVQKNISLNAGKTK